MKPDLESPEGRTAYAAELGRVVRGWRWSGLGLVTLAAVGLYLTAIWHRPWGSPLGLAVIAALVVGWGLVIVAIAKRTRYHKHRMQGWPGHHK